MLEQDDLKWIATTSTELNTALQQAARYADLARRHTGAGDNEYIEMLSERVEVASRAAQSLFDRVTTKILETTTARGATSAASASAQGQAAEGHSGSQSAIVGRASGVPAEIKIKNPDGPRELILLIDDEPEIAEFASEVMAEEGYKVIVARDGFEALKIFQQINRQIALVILDFFLPVMDGDAVFEELKALNPNVNVVLSSGFAEQNKMGAMLAQGLRGFIPKPYTREKLLEQVRSTIEASRRPIR
jgi:CheY-like chemotaxis protein